MKTLNRAQWVVLALALLTVAISIVTNYATASLPRWLEDNPWITWLALGILVVAFVTISLLQTRETGVTDLPDKADEPLYTSDTTIPPSEDTTRPEVLMEYDVFLSQNSSDKPAVELLAHRLRNIGLKPWLDKWNLIPGAPWQEAIEDALDACKTVVVFLGPKGIGTWENEEMRSALETRVRDSARRVIPVLLPGAPDPRDRPLPRFLSRLTWVDFRDGLDDEDAFHRLVSGIRGVAPGSPHTTTK